MPEILSGLFESDIFEPSVELSISIKFYLE